MDLPPRLAWLLYEVYPYVAVTICLLGCLIRFDREPYSWKSDSSEVIGKRSLLWGSNLFHYGVLIVLAGHLIGFLAPESLVYKVITPIQHELLAMIVGGIAGAIALVGMTILIYRRLAIRHIRANSRKWDIIIIIMLWFQLLFGLWTIYFSAQTLHTGEFENFIHYVQALVYFQGEAWTHLQGAAWAYHAHILLGFTILLVSPFTRMVHLLSGVATVSYLFRPYQLVRKDTRSANPMS